MAAGERRNTQGQDAGGTEGQAFVPAVDIHDTDEAAVLVADLPGCGEGDVHVSFDEGVLTIRGRVEPVGEAGRELTYCEFRTGDFERSFSVSETVDVSRIEGTVKDGVLRLVLAKAAEAKSRRIPIRSG